MDTDTADMILAPMILDSEEMVATAEAIVAEVTAEAAINTAEQGAAANP